MKWIRYVVPLVSLVVVATAEAQWSTPTRYVTSSSVGTSRMSTTRVNRLIVADEPPPVAAGEETIVTSEEGVPFDDGAAPCSCGHWGHKLWGCGCKAKKTCCAVRTCAPTCAPKCCAAKCWSPCGLSLPKITFGCSSCDAPAACDVCGSAPGCRPKWLHGCSACRPALSCYLPKITWSSGPACGCQGPVTSGEEIVVPQEEPQPSGEPIETPRATPRAAPRPAPSPAPADPIDPAAKSASLGWQPRNRTRTANAWDAPQPGYSRPATYEYRTR